MTKGAPSRRGVRNRTNDAPTVKTSKAKRGAGTDWNKLRHLSDAGIRRGIASDPDVRPTDEEFWKNAKVVWPTRKTVVTMRLDADLLAWFRQQRGYQTRINAILRTYMKAHASGEHRGPS
ncbi:MAG TPA: BrnA antitoxin family protein [Terriglobales bacterium]|nr:BrnA antitoxin family protein [Terriglobales bacterium]